MRTHTPVITAVLSLALAPVTDVLAREAHDPQANAPEPKVEQLQPLQVEGSVVELTAAHLAELRTRILAQGLNNPRGCSADIRPLFVCRVGHQAGSLVKVVRCGSNADYCRHISKVQVRYNATTKLNEHGFDSSLDGVLNDIARDNFSSYVERTSYARLKNQIMALPGKPEDNMKYVEALVAGWPPVGRRPSRKTLHGFARAYLAIADIGKRMDPLIRRAGKAAQRNAIQRRENRAFGAAIVAQGLQADQYNKISQDTQRYFLLRKAVMHFLQTERQGEPAASIPENLPPARI